MRVDNRAVPVALAAVLIGTIGFGIVMPVFPALLKPLGHIDIDQATRVASYGIGIRRGYPERRVPRFLALAAAVIIVWKVSTGCRTAWSSNPHAPVVATSRYRGASPRRAPESPQS